MNRNKALFAIVFPILIMAGWTALQAYRAHFGKIVELKVMAYDPRNLLSGHYLRYAVDFGKNNPCQESPKGAQCVCLEITGPGDLATNRYTFDCEENSHCPLYLRGRCEGRTFLAGIEQFYFPESYKVDLTTVPQASTIRVHLDNQGRGVVTDFLIGGVPLLESVNRAHP